MKRLMSCILCIAILLISTVSVADTVWVLCQPDSYVNIRAVASGRSKIEGYALCGDSLETDGKTQRGFLHIYAPIEACDGWVSLGYIVWNEPHAVNAQYYICSPYRVAIRKTIGGERRKWAYALDELQVYWMSTEWSVTNKGFVKTEYLEEDHGT